MDCKESAVGTDSGSVGQTDYLELFFMHLAIVFLDLGSSTFFCISILFFIPFGEGLFFFEGFVEDDIFGEIFEVNVHEVFLLSAE